MTSLIKKVLEYAKKKGQIVGRNNDYYITVEQLDNLQKTWKKNPSAR